MRTFILLATFFATALASAQYSPSRPNAAEKILRGDTTTQTGKLNIQVDPKIGDPPAVPEPATMAILGVGAAGMLARKRRRA